MVREGKEEGLGWGGVGATQQRVLCAMWSTNGPCSVLLLLHDHRPLDEAVISVPLLLRSCFLSDFLSDS